MSEDATTPLLVRMPSALHEAIRVEAGRADRSMASVVRLAVESYLDGRRGAVGRYGRVRIVSKTIRDRGEAS